MVSPSDGGFVTLPLTVDLMKLGRAVEARGGSKKLIRALRTAWRAQSCFADLRQAQGACDALDALLVGSASLDPGTLLHLQSGTLATAILLYARATSSSSAKANERGATQLDLGKLTSAQAEDHQTLLRIRNGAIGHVESGTDIAGDYWHRDFLFAKRADVANWEVASASTSIGFHRDIFLVLKRQLPIASAQLQAKSRERLQGAMGAIREMGLKDSDLLRYQIDPVKWFGSAHAALMLLSTKSGEEAAAWTPLF